MNEFKHHHSQWHHRLNIVVLAGTFISVGLLMLGRNLGWISDEIFHFIVNWKMLLILLGVIQLIKSHFLGGIVLILTGGYFLFPELSVLGAPWIATYWPVLFIIAGISILFKKWDFKNGRFHMHKKKMKEECITRDGYVTSEVSFGSLQQVVLDPVFRGATINNSFGSCILDLRKTTLESPETFIDVDCSFGAIEFYIPEHWNVSVHTDNSFSGVSDKRFCVNRDLMDKEHKLIIKGDLSFSGIEIKN